MAEPQAVTKLRDTLLDKGPVSFKTLSKKFFALDKNKDWQLTRDELRDALSALGVTISDDDLTVIFNAFEKGTDGKINQREFIFGILPPITEKRKEMVRRAFNNADRSGDYVITIADMRGIFNPNSFKDYKDGTKTEDQVFSDFLKEFDETEDAADGMITQMEFLSYYAVKSKDIESDEDFQKLLNDTWKLSE